MSKSYTAASFTKNFGWNESYGKLHRAIQKGFSAGLSPTTRETWRKRSHIGDRDRELIPLNFFLFTMRGPNDDFVMVDRLVERAAALYDDDFARLGLFAFNLSTSGNWRRSKWRDGRVAGWANEFIRTVVWQDGAWRTGSFIEPALRAFIDKRIDAEDVTKDKVFTNYRYMLISAGVLVDGKMQAAELESPWPYEAIQLFWDRQVFCGELHSSSGRGEFEAAFLRNEVHKLIGCTPKQGRAYVLRAYQDYSARWLPQRMEHLEELRGRLAA
jgi:hypothetical protein